MLGRGLVVAVLGLVASGVLPPLGPWRWSGKDDLKRLQGRWQTVKIVHNGVSAPLKGAQPWTIAGSKVIYGSGTADEIKLDPSRTPRAMDIRAHGQRGQAKDLKAIYALKGDELTMCVDIGGKGRPEAFASKAGSGHRLIVLKRLKE